MMWVRRSFPWCIGKRFWFELRSCRVRQVVIHRLKDLQSNLRVKFFTLVLSQT